MKHKFSLKCIQQIKNYSILAFFAFLYSIYVFFSYRKFGTTWDESIVYDWGKKLYQHLFIPKHNESASLILRASFDVVEPTYNNTYAAILYMFNQKQQFETYHLMNMLFASFIFITSYYFLNHKYKKPLLSILGPIFIVLNPRFFGDIATNPKDMSFAVFYFVSIVAIYFTPYIKNVTLRVLILGLLFSLSQSSRIVGFTLYPILFIYDTYRWCCRRNIRTKDNPSTLNFIFSETIFITSIFICSSFFMIITWPYIGSNYFKNFINVLRTSGSFPWPGNIYFLGKNYVSANLPLLYLPIWLLISQPIFISVSLIASIFTLPKLWKKNELLVLSILPIAINLLLYFILKPAIYDAARHYLFLYPLFSIVSAIFIIDLLKTEFNLAKRIFIMLAAINIVLVIASQVKLFPYQYVYFNELVGGLSGGAKNFETDYWNASFKESITWLKINRLKQDRKYNIYPCSYFSGMDQYLSENINYVKDYAIADYAICFTRFQEYNKLNGKVIHIVTRDSEPLNYVIENTH